MFMSAGWSREFGGPTLAPPDGAKFTGPLPHGCGKSRRHGRPAAADNPAMLFLLSPAKSLDYETPLPHTVPAATRPKFVDEAAELIGLLRQKSAQQVGELMAISDNLAELNAARYRDWSPRFTAHNSRQAALAFNGDVYGGFDARTLGADDLEWAQQHVCILSGLYGVLRPLDRLQPYRLEMGTALANPQGRDLYRYWAGRIAPHLNQRLRGDPHKVVVNLASHEYFRSVDVQALKAPVVECVFEEWRPGQGGKRGDYKIISFMAKRARGLMARYAVAHRATTTRALEGFDLEGYAFHAAASGPERLVFRRKT